MIIIIISLRACNSAKVITKSVACMDDGCIGMVQYSMMGSWEDGTCRSPPSQDLDSRLVSNLDLPSISFHRVFNRPKETLPTSYTCNNCRKRNLIGRKGKINPPTMKKRQKSKKGFKEGSEKLVAGPVPE